MPSNRSIAAFITSADKNTSLFASMNGVDKSEHKRGKISGNKPLANSRNREVEWEKVGSKLALNGTEVTGREDKVAASDGRW